MRRLSLSSRVTLFTMLGLCVVWVLAVALMSSVLWSEQDELFDQQLSETAYVLLPLMSPQSVEAGAARTAPQPQWDPTQAAAYRIFDRAGTIRLEFGMPDGVVMPEPLSLQANEMVKIGDYRFYTTAFNPEGLALQVAAPLAERREAYRESLLGFLLPMLALLPLAWLITRWMTRRALAPMHALRSEISARDGQRLDPIDAGDWPEDLVRIAGTLNGFMARLTQALDAERAFATNAAHELRTPVAIALAQVQQLRESGALAGAPEQTGALERALQRMRRLVARLLQLARADSGIGRSAEAHDIVQLARLVLADITPRAALDRIDADLPEGPVPALIDSDAFAIVLGNLIDNALQYAPATSKITVTIQPDGMIEVANDSAPVPELGTLPRRFTRRGPNGFGLGLHICGQIIEQAGGRLDLISPRPGRQDGFLARVRLPVPPAPEAA